MQTLALTGHAARRWEPKRLRLPLLSIAGPLAATGRRTWLHLARPAPFTGLALDGLRRVDALIAPRLTTATPSRRPLLTHGLVEPGDHPHDTGPSVTP
jgi:hypothetical protein